MLLFRPAVNEDVIQVHSTLAPMAELLGRLAARGEQDVHEKAAAAFVDAAPAKEMISRDNDDIIMCKTNNALFVTAKP